MIGLQGEGAALRYECDSRIRLLLGFCGTAMAQADLSHGRWFAHLRGSSCL
jgi:hypothetical protein